MKRKQGKTTIRQMEIDDISAVYHLGEKLFTSEELPILYRTWDPYEVTDYFSSDPDYCLVAEVDGKVGGFILANTIIKEATAWKRYGYLSWIGVDEAFQRTGLGLRLYRELEERFRKEGVRMIIADTETENEEAIAFFKTIGFSPARRHVWLAKNLRRSANTDSRKARESRNKPESGKI